MSERIVMSFHTPFVVRGVSVDQYIFLSEHGGVIPFDMVEEVDFVDHTIQLRSECCIIDHVLFWRIVFNLFMATIPAILIKTIEVKEVNEDGCV